MLFIDLAKAYYRVLRHAVWRCLREHGVAEKYVGFVIYEDAKTKFNTNV